MSESLRITFGDNWALTTDKIGKIINQIYIIEKKKTKMCPPFSYTFYKNILPKIGHNERINVYTIKLRIELSDIKKELGATSSDMSLENSIQKRKTKILSQLDSNHKEILLEGIF